MIIPACFAQRASPAEMAAPFGSSRLGVGLVTALVWALAAWVPAPSNWVC